VCCCRRAAFDARGLQRACTAPQIPARVYLEAWYHARQPRSSSRHQDDNAFHKYFRERALREHSIPRMSARAGNVGRSRSAISHNIQSKKKKKENWQHKIKSVIYDITHTKEITFSIIPPPKKESEMFAQLRRCAAKKKKGKKKFSESHKSMQNAISRATHKKKNFLANRIFLLAIPLERQTKKSFIFPDSFPLQAPARWAPNFVTHFPAEFSAENTAIK
jgi:hypothetical protein